MTTLRTWPVRTETRARNRSALLAAAAELVEQHGYAGTSVGAIAEQAGLSTGAVYSIFGSKVELFLELLLQDWHVPTADEMPRGASDVPTFLDAYARHWVAGLRAGDAVRAFELEMELYLAALRDPRVMAKTRTIASASLDQLADELSRLSHGGAALPMPATELARSVVALLQGLSQMAVAAGEEPDAELFARATRRLCLDAGAAS